MDKRSGFKECSRCGLRNKPAARQCDFCGQKFEVYDDWELQIDALEKLSGRTEKVLVTDDVSRKIEATIVRKDSVERKVPEAPAPPPAPAPVPIVVAPPPAPLKVEPQPVVPVAVEPEPVIETVEVEATMVKPESVDMVSEVSGPLADVPIQTERSRRRPRRTGFFSWNLQPDSLVSVAFMIVLVAGVMLYALTLLLSGSFLSSASSWTLTFISGTMVVAGTSKLLINWDFDDQLTPPEEIDPQIIEICPDCHEKVSAKDEQCPACGTDFDPLDN